MVAKIISSVFFVGYFPFAGGSVASILAFLFFWFIPIDSMASLLVLSGFFALGIYFSNISEKIWGTKDDSRIVIDEFLSAGFAVMFISKSIWLYVLAFFLFRFFDILKPLGINRIQNLKSGYGVMLDDLLAAIYTNVILQVVMRLY